MKETKALLLIVFFVSALVLLGWVFQYPFEELPIGVVEVSAAIAALGSLGFCVLYARMIIR